MKMKSKVQQIYISNSTWIAKKKRLLFIYMFCDDYVENYHLKFTISTITISLNKT